jgi:hypothetical protein
MAVFLSKKPESGAEKSQLSEKDARLLLLLCTELISLCARLTDKIDPVSAAMITYVRDEIKIENEL